MTSIQPNDHPPAAPSPEVPMVIPDDRERFIPFSKAEVVDLLCADGRLDEEQQQSFRELCTILQSIFHFEFQEKVERLKKNFAPFDPDLDVKTKKVWSGEDLERMEDALIADLGEVLTAANYDRLSDAELATALERQSPLLRLNLHVDFDEFSRCIVFCRGDTTRTEIVESWFGLRKREVEINAFERVVLYLHFKPREYFEAHHSLTRPLVTPGSTMIKLFRSVPKADLEMLFPNTRLAMKPLDLALLVVPAVGGLVALLPKILLLGVTLWALVTTFEVEHPRALLGLGALLGTVLGFMARQWDKYKSKKLDFVKTVSDRLYFQNIDNNAGVFHHLIDAAEEEECKEVMLAYYLLWTTEAGLTEPALDSAVERWFATEHDTRIDFEVDDALAKLERLGLAQQDAQGVWSVQSLAASKERLDHLWDNFFQHNRG
jgi:hypothetical protein